MSRLLMITVFFCFLEGDCWTSIVINSERRYIIKNEGKLQNVEDLLSTTDADLVINGDSSTVIRSGYSFPLGDTVIIELFETTESYHNLFDIVILNNKYLIRYSREINETEFVQKFEPIKSKLELNSLDFSDGSKIRGHVEYTGKCIIGCSDKIKKMKIVGNFAVKIHRY